ncbi:MAG: T9SS-dependent M36 family metallopeptidase [Bacteroidota bacterium]
MIYRCALACAACLLAVLPAFSQTTTPPAAVRAYLDANHPDLGLTADDVADVVVTDLYSSERSGVTHVYLRQALDGVPVFNTFLGIHLDRQGRVFKADAQFVAGLRDRLDDTGAALDASTAARTAFSVLHLPTPLALTRIPEAQRRGGIGDRGTYFDADDFTLDPIRTEFVYFATEEGTVRPAWHVSLNPAMTSDYWSLRLDAATGQELERHNWTIHERFEAAPAKAVSRPISLLGSTAHPLQAQGATYNVFPMPVESPNHGSRALVSNVDDPDASPFGWHDINGRTGADFTFTRGNNVFAYEDRDSLNVAGDRPDGGADLVFDNPLDFNADPSSYTFAAVTNLFYWNNIAHDVFYHYGFDEAAGNFQQRNYTGRGQGVDFVRAEAQDGLGFNNANFATPPDGSRPRMQMFLWRPTNPNVLQVSAPDNLVGEYTIGRATFGRGFPREGLRGRVVLGKSELAAGGFISDGCRDLSNTDELNGNIAIMDRGDCTFVSKVRRAQDAGATGVIVANDEPGSIVTLAGDDEEITIPSGMVSLRDGFNFKTAAEAGTLEVNIVGTSAQFNDSSFDNGIVIHEYGHGVSIRLTGGPARSGCLINNEQAGEGWSDFFGLAFTATPDQRGSTTRGIATYANGDPIDGQGIRRQPYSTDMSINSMTYDTIKEARSSGDGGVVPHDVGAPWAMMLWEMYWMLVDQHGFDTDFYRGTGGNNIAMQLVVEGLKLQPCNPGFVDARNAILEADAAIYGGANSCTVWNAFAKRGLGVSADQGNADNARDGTEGFDMPAECEMVTNVTGDEEQPGGFVLHGTYPNPFNPTTTVRFDLPEAAEVEVRVYDLMGREVWSSPRQLLTAGNGRTLPIDGGRLASGVYLYRVTALGSTAKWNASGKMTLLK